MGDYKFGGSSVGRAIDCDSICRGFKSRPSTQLRVRSRDNESIGNNTVIASMSSLTPIRKWNAALASEKKLKCLV